MYQSIPLDQIRQKIDSLDNQIHDLLMERADLIMAISEEKKRAGIQIVQPAREARMIRRLMARHRGPLPEETIVRIWRELVSSVSLLQTGLSVAVYVPPEVPEYWDMARDYFGTVLPMTRSVSPEEALDMVNSGKVTFAVLPFPEEGEGKGWWTKVEDGISVIQRLPYGKKEHFDFHSHPALVVARAGFGESGDDHSLVSLSFGNDVSAEAVRTALEKSGLSVEGIYGAERNFIFDLHKYFGADDSLTEIESALSGFGNVTARLLGGYPAQLTYHDK